MKSAASKGRKIGRPAKHGGYSIIHQDELLGKNPHIRRYLQDCRDGLVRDVAGSEEALSEQQRIMIDRIVSRLSICRLIETYVEKYGAFRRDRIRRDKVLELEPALGVNYLAFSNSIDRALVALGLDRVEPPGMNLTEIIRQVDAENAQKAAAEKAGREAASPGGEGQGQGETSSGAGVEDAGQVRDEDSGAESFREGDPGGGKDE